MSTYGIPERVIRLCIYSAALYFTAPAMAAGQPVEAGEGPQQWCSRAQQKVEGYCEQSLPSDRIDVTVQDGKKEFLKSKPSIDGGKIYNHVYTPASDERGSGFDELWCKMKSRDAIADAGLAAAPAGEPGTCQAMNQAAVDRALRHDPHGGHHHEKPDIRITCLPDQQFSRGDQWVSSSVLITQQDDGTVAVRASSLRTPAWVPWLGGNQYCKLLSPRGAEELVACMAGSCDRAGAARGEPYAIAETDGMYPEGKRFTLTVEGDEVDVYLPDTGAGKPLAAAVYLQGAKCDKRFYRTQAELVASYGFVVAVANHSGLLGTNFTDQKVLNRVWRYLKEENRTSASPLFRKIDTRRLALMGHSFGGVVGLKCLQSACSIPTCFGFSYESPEELAAVVVYGTNGKSPMGGFMDVPTRGIPVLYINGDRDGKALLADTKKTFSEKTSGGPKALAVVHGANHYGVTDLNNPPGSDADPSAPTMAQKQALASIARVSGIFMLAHVYGDAAARDYIYAGQGRTDPAVTLETK